MKCKYKEKNVNVCSDCISNQAKYFNYIKICLLSIALENVQQELDCLRNFFVPVYRLN